MTEHFIRNALSLMGEDDSLNKVKLIRNKYTGELATYGFLQFDSDAAALMTMHKLNGKIIPNSQPVRPRYPSKQRQVVPAYNRLPLSFLFSPSDSS